MNNFDLDIVFTWRSSMCGCSAALRESLEVNACDQSHRVWAEIVAEESIHLKQRNFDKILRRGYDVEFQRLLDRWLQIANLSGSFFREPLVLDGNLPAPMAMYVIERLGVEIARCASPGTLASYQQGKAIFGLIEGEWLEGYHWPEGRLVFPEELVSGGRLTEEEAKKLFKRASLDSALLRIFEVRR